MKKKLKNFGITAIAVVVFSSCVNLKHVNDFSSSSLKGVKSFKELNYSFKQSCLDKCIEENINNLLIKTKECDCKQEKIADKLTGKIYSAIYGYFDGLSKLSDGKLTSYKTKDLESALTEGYFGSITIKKEQVESYSKVSKILIRAFTDSYRKNRIKEFVKDANEPLLELLSFLDFNFSSNLKGKLNVKKERIETDYFDLLKDHSLSSLEKRNAVKEYYTRVTEIESQINKLNAYSKTLSKISKGHEKLFNDIDKLKGKELKQVLLQYANEIEAILSEFKK